MSDTRFFDIAVIGVAGRWPGADGPAGFWQLLSGGVDAIRPFTEDELRRRGVDERRLRDPQFVKAGAVLDDADRFAAAFFGYSPREAELMDPQHRVFLESAWEALEDAGYAPRHAPGPVGVYASCGLSTYLLWNLAGNPAVDEKDESFQAMIGADKDFVATRVSYKLNLTGPSVSIQTGCSSSLVAVSLAVQGLLTYQCDLALAGGVAIAARQRAGYFHQPGGIASSDGHCRPFSAAAEGTVFGDGAGVVVLKRLAEALQDGDQIYAVIRSAAVNNDGAAKVGYTAPSVAGQTDVVRRALAIANVTADSIGYVEAHGTATALGDPAEIAALSDAFGAGAPRRACAIGSVKGNIGHCDAAAGISGLVKTILMLKHRALVPSLHFDAPNPRIDFGESPFYVNTQLTEWAATSGPRRAGVSSFGIGGTNAHVILEEAPERPRGSEAPRPMQILTLSAESRDALEAATDRLAAHLAATPDAHLADVAFTAQVGREVFRHRRAVLCETVAQAADRLRARTRDVVHTADVTGGARTPVFMFPGGGAQSPGMGRDLYRSEAVFRAAVDTCADHVARTAGFDLRDVLYRDEPFDGHAPTRLAMALPAIFTTSYALVQLLASWGVRPAAMIGHSLGEYVAACVAGVLSLEDALGVVALRGRLIDSVPEGAMLSVYASGDAIAALGLTDVSIAAVNTPDNCVLAASPEAIARAEEALAARGIECRRLRINAAAHSAAVDPIVEPLRAHLRGLAFHPPAIPYISNLTGTWIAPEEATDPDHWARHLREPVQFAAGIAELARQPNVTFIEVGPGRTLGSLAKAQLTAAANGRTPSVVSMMRHPDEARTDEHALCDAAARLWLAGVDLDWRQAGGGGERRRVSLPTYPFVRTRYWIDPPAAGARGEAAARRVDDWCHVPRWTRATAPRSIEITDDDRAASWVIFAGEHDASAALVERLGHAGARVTTIHAGDRFARTDESGYTVRASSHEDYAAVLHAMRAAGACDRIVAVHLWTWSPADLVDDRVLFDGVQHRGLYSVTAFARAAAAAGVQADVLVVTSHAAQVTGADPIVAANATVRAACLVLPQELPRVRCRAIDLAPPSSRVAAGTVVADCVLAECAWDGAEPFAAYRAGERWMPQFERVQLAAGRDREWLRQDGVYVLVGGTGDVGLTLAQAFARFKRCTLVLTGRSGAQRPDAAAAVAAIESRGSRAVVYAANAADLHAMQTCFDDVEQRFGPINGVVHLAGVTGAAALCPVADVSSAECDAQFTPKAGGAYVLKQLVAGRAIDFCVTFSSTASILGGVGMLPYAAANMFLDAFAAAPSANQAPRWIDINWDGWLTPGAAHVRHAALARYAMQPDEAIEVFDRVLSSTASSPLSRQIVVSTGDLQARIAQWTRAESPVSETESTTQARPSLSSDYVAPRTPAERTVAEVWSRVLGVEHVGVHDNLFELGGNSLIALRIVAQLTRATGVAVRVTTLFEAPTVELLAASLAATFGDAPAAPAAPAAPEPLPVVSVSESRPPIADEERSGFAIVGMSGRFPGAADVDELWSNLAAGRESIARSDHAIETAPDGQRFVRATAMLADYQSFDAEFFGMPPTEAALRDPQHRLFLEQAWAALEHAGYDGRRYAGRVGVFGGATTNTYLMRNIGSRPDVLASVDPVQVNIANGPDFLTTLVSYKLNLTGPSHTVQSACSTSLVALHCACRSLMTRECDMALAGGVSVNLLLADGYRPVEGGILSADGRCRAFDADASGTVFGSGVGVVVLKRLEDAIADGDAIHAIVRGSAINNDGGVKAGYTAPSVDGETRVIEEALRAARVSPEAVSYVECHGTATNIGDPIEVRALTRAYGAGPGRQGTCALGSVKTNIGHLDAAAGVAGLIKVVESLKHGMLVPSLHFRRANPEIDFAATPFFVNTALQAWRSSGVRRAGVSAFGVGGTNAHVIVEEAPAPPAPAPSRPWQLIVWSAKTAVALEAASTRLGAALRDADPAALADIAYTLQTGRQRMAWRRAVVRTDASSAAAALASGVADAAHDATEDDTPGVVFVFPDERALAPGAGRELYASERIYREAMDRCARAIGDALGGHLCELWYERAVAETLRDSALAPIATVATTYALVELWKSWGVRPAAMFGHGLGEYVAATVAGVWPIDTLLALVVERARLMQTLRGAELIEALTTAVARVPRGEPAIPFVSSATGTWITSAEAQDASYWGRQASASATLDRGLDALVAGGRRFVLDVGPGDELLRRVRGRGLPAAASLGASMSSEQQSMLEALGRMWTAGVEVDWRGFYADERRQRVPLPTYPFQRTRCWIDPAAPQEPATVRPAAAAVVEPQESAAPPLRAVARGKRPSLRNAYVGPRDATERALVEIVEAALGIEPVGVTDRFGELGGDSLHAVRIVQAINARLGVHLHVVDLFDTVTVRDVAAKLSSEPARAAAAR